MRNFIFTLILGISVAQLAAGEKEKKAAANSNAAVPAALVGQWQSGSISTANFYDAATQQWNEPNGRGMFLIVQANGEYRFGAGEQITSTDYFLHQEGTVAINGLQIVFSPKMASEYVRDVCVHQDDQRASTKDELQATTLKFQIVANQADGRGAELMLTNEHGEQIILRSHAQ